MANKPYFKKSAINAVVRTVREKASKTKKPFIVAVTGNSRAGKGYLCTLLKKEFADASFLPMDSYLYNVKTRHKNNITGAHPHSCNINKFLTDMQKLVRGQPIKIILRNGRTLKIPASKIIFLEGICVLLIPCWKKLYNLTILIECTPEELWKRTLEREKKRKTFNIKKSKKNFELRQQQYKKYIESQKKTVDLILNSGSKPAAFKISASLRVAISSH